jgi:tRNA-guanine family transglycosylase
MAKVQFKTASEILGARLHTLHNFYYYQSLMQSLRAAIEARQLDQFSKRFYAEVAPDLGIRARIETRLFTGETLWTY